MWKGGEESKDGSRSDEMKDSIVYEVRSRGRWLIGWIWPDRTVRVGWRSEFWRRDGNVED